MSKDNSLAKKNFPKELKKINQWNVYNGKRPVSTKTNEFKKAEKSYEGQRYKEIKEGKYKKCEAGLYREKWIVELLSYKEAKKMYETGAYDGFCFKFSDSGYHYEDLDTYNKKANKKLHKKILKRGLALTYVELSQSGKGHHIIAKGSKPDDVGKVDAIDSFSNQFMFITGDRIGKHKKLKHLDNDFYSLYPKKVSKLSHKMIETGKKTKLGEYRGAKQESRPWREHIENPDKKDRSGSIWAVICGAVNEGYSDKKIYKLMNKHPIGDKYRENDADWLQKQIDKAREESTNVIETDFALIEDIFGLTSEDIKLSDTAICLSKGIAIEGQLSIIIAKPNAGKSAILFFSVSRALAKAGKKVMYIDLDSAATDRGLMQQFSERSGFTHVCPDAKRNTTLSDLMGHLETLSNSDNDLTKCIFIIDTLKKLNDMMNKHKTKATLDIFKRLTGLGATVIILGHANKRDEQNGDMMYEGTNEILSESDSLTYMYSTKNKKTKDVTVSLYPKKVRGDLGKATFYIKGGKRTSKSLKKLVKEIDFIDIREKNKEYKGTSFNKVTIGELEAQVRDAFSHFSLKEIDRDMIHNYVSVGKNKLDNFLTDYSKGEKAFLSIRKVDKKYVYKLL